MDWVGVIATGGSFAYAAGAAALRGGTLVCRAAGCAVVFGPQQLAFRYDEVDVAYVLREYGATQLGVWTAGGRYAFRTAEDDAAWLACLRERVRVEDVSAMQRARVRWRGAPTELLFDGERAVAPFCAGGFAVARDGTVALFEALSSGGERLCFVRGARRATGFLYCAGGVLAARLRAAGWAVAALPWVGAVDAFLASTARPLAEEAAAGVLGEHALVWRAAGRGE